MGTFVISLDFELHWGVRDHLRVEDYTENLLGVRQAIPAMLALFSELEIHATWATVGFLFFENIDELLAAIPDELPKYSDPRLDPYGTLSELGRGEADDPFHYAPSLIRLIQATPGQEIATHTFSHYYANEPGPGLGAFRSDIRAAIAAGKRLGVETKSIVFPRNQVSAAHVRICAEEGISAYRGLESDPFVAAGTGAGARAKRLLDQYVNLSGDGSGAPICFGEKEIVSVPQSRFLRPCTPGLPLLERMRLQRILSSMTSAAQKRRLFHLWWHPHNFGVNTDANLRFLRAILEHYRQLRRRYDFSSQSMAEVAEGVLAASGASCRASYCWWRRAFPPTLFITPWPKNFP
jgi:peptidoglycan/xylan/chitin deacetylase (PgdA/CDA1 family)